MKTYDIFITHAWRNHVDWIAMADLLDSAKDITWRNFSLPWYDPALDPNTDLGGRTIREILEKQVIPVTAVILLSGVYAIPSSRKWLDIELDYARRHGKPVIAVPAFANKADPCRDTRTLADALCDWDAVEIIAAIEGLRGAAALPSPRAGANRAAD